ncbi:nucleoid occlusion protein [Clostridium sp. CF012]|uniref:nucleoid occlusion protein n=1 Tax=Clostridium sp. CF012 TaxID=2843319 RepID=UPI001C0C60CD|nr:nucleoid occlusion protein [Clostridium sp. CF012]MBU3144570.1 nucleoid occlusion protein [Clostridium sp. CF012]
MQNDVKYVSIELISPNVYQPRKHFNEETIQELSQSIKAYGIIQPLTVRKSGDIRYELVAGERRLRAAKKIGLQQVPVIIIDITDKDSAAIALLENLQREDLNFLEEASAYYNLIQDHSYTQEQLAQVIGKKQSTIANKLRLLKLDKQITNSLIENKLTERHARALLKLNDINIQKKVLKIVIDKTLNVKNTEELIEKELLKLCRDEVATDGKKKIKGIFSPRVYINTIKQVFDKYGINADYKSRELEDSIEVTIRIPKK